MKITRISVYQVDLPLREADYRWSGGKSVAVFDSTVVRLETDAGLDGWGEVCPLGPVYLPAYAEGARLGIGTIAPAVLDRLRGDDRSGPPDHWIPGVRAGTGVSCAGWRLGRRSCCLST